MATLTLTYAGKFTVTRTVTIPDEHHDDYIDSHIERLNLHHPGKDRPVDQQVVESHLDAIIHDINMVFASYVNRKLANAYIATLPTVRLKNG
jgi:hypothetical protein